jgi:hypothetical protein
MKNLELTHVEAEALARELARIVDGDRYPLSPRIRSLRTVPTSSDRSRRNRLPHRRRGSTSRRAMVDTGDAGIRRDGQAA